MDSAAPSGAVSVTKEMGINHADFFRILPRALDSTDYTVDGRNIVFEQGGRRFEIALSEERTRRIASFALPVTSVTITLHGYGEREAEEALRRFDFYFRRGGG